MSSDVIGCGDGLGGPREDWPVRQRILSGARFRRALPAFEASVEERRRLIHDPQHPHQARGPCSIAIVICNDGLAVLNARHAEGCGERLR
jgi:hypothetical protein